MLCASFPIKKLFFSIITLFPQILRSTCEITSDVTGHSQKICGLVSSFTPLITFSSSSCVRSLRRSLFSVIIPVSLQNAHFLSTLPKCEITVLPCISPCALLNRNSLKPRSRNCIFHSVKPMDTNRSSMSMPNCSQRVLTGLIEVALKSV
jgi:hypothetical protein